MWTFKFAFCFWCLFLLHINEQGLYFVFGAITRLLLRDGGTEKLHQDPIVTSQVRTSISSHVMVRLLPASKWWVEMAGKLSKGSDPLSIVWNMLIQTQILQIIVC